MGVTNVRRVIVFIVALFTTTAASAHEIGTLQVRALFQRDHTYVIDVIALPETIAKRLHGDPITKHLSIAFNNVRVTPKVENTEYGVRLTGEIPPRTETFTWRYDLTFSSYVITLENQGHGATRQWLEGDALSHFRTLPETLG